MRKVSWRLLVGVVDEHFDSRHSSTKVFAINAICQQRGSELPVRRFGLYGTNIPSRWCLFQILGNYWNFANFEIPPTSL